MSTMPYAEERRGGKFLTLFVIAIIIVFPTRVGMNRQGNFCDAGTWGIPHTRGDEPPYSSARYGRRVVFPTRVGMNRVHGRAARTTRAYSPHAWG